MHLIVKDGDLGGCEVGAIGDPRSYVPLLWESMLDDSRISSVLDIGAGFGHASRWFAEHGCRVVGIEGSEEVVQSSGLDYLRVHDFSLGPIRDLDKFDLCWCSEFAEHVEQQHEQNWIDAAKHCRILALTAAMPGQGGHHHVNEQPLGYWVERLEPEGFRYSSSTMWYRALAAELHPGCYFATTGLIFLNMDLMDFSD